MIPPAYYRCQGELDAADGNGPPVRCQMVLPVTDLSVISGRLLCPQCADDARGSFPGVEERSAIGVDLSSIAEPVPPPAPAPEPDRW